MGHIKGIDHKCTFIDVNYGEWEAYPQNVFKGKGHPSRALKEKGEYRRYTNQK